MTTNQKTTGLYVTLGLCVLMTCTPVMALQNFAGLLSLILLITAYILRYKSDKESLESHHATYIIRTIWVWSAFVILGMIGAGMMISQNGDMSAIDDLINSANNGFIPDEDGVEQTVNAYFETNYALILKTTLMWLAPAQIYAIWRITRGLPRAMKGERLPNEKAWF